MEQLINLGVLWAKLWLIGEFIGTAFAVLLTVIGIGYIIYCIAQNHKRY